MNLYLLKLNFTGPVHFGEAGIGIEGVSSILHSDSFFSALCNGWVELFGSDDLEQTLLEPMQNGNSSLLLSSLFYFGRDTYYLPRPITEPDVQITPKDIAEYGKRVRKAKYIPLEIFLQWVKGEKLNIYQRVSEVSDEYQDCFVEYVTPKVSLDRDNLKSNIYHCGLVKYQENCGLYCLFKLDDSIIDKLQAVVSLLADSGIGGKRSIGYGAFIPEWINVENVPLWKELFQSSPDDQAWCTLSLVNPKPGEISHEMLVESAYNLIQRRGWIFSTAIDAQLKKQSCRMFTEGSVFPTQLEGRIVDVTPKDWLRAEYHRVYRYGLALTVPIRR